MNCRFFHYFYTIEQHTRYETNDYHSHRLLQRMPDLAGGQSGSNRGHHEQKARCRSHSDTRQRRWRRLVGGLSLCTRWRHARADCAGSSDAAHYCPLSRQWRHSRHRNRSGQWSPAAHRRRAESNGSYQLWDGTTRCRCRKARLSRHQIAASV